MNQKALPKIAIVGRPNVGKSTLFNRIVGKRIAVVEDQPGVTRDRLYAEAEWGSKRFIMIDTGGILFGDDDPLVEQIKVQAEVALAEADVIIFLADAVDGLTTGDYDLANQLRGVKVPVILAINKADNPKRAASANEFFALGIGDEVMPISSLHGDGVADLLDLIIARIPALDELPERAEEIKLAIVGRPNVGKSSILNAFTGEQRAIVSNIPGTTRDAVDTLVQYRDEAFRLIDTAGLRRRGKVQGTVEFYMALRSSRAIERCDAALVLVDGSEGLTDGDNRIMKMAHDEGKALVVAVNKWDLVEPPDGSPQKTSPEKKDLVRIIRDEMPETNYAPIRFTSALESSGLSAVLDTVLMALENWSFRISTGHLNRLIQEAVFARPFTTKGKLLKVYYATQVSTRPPTFVLFCNDPDMMHFSYKRYLENQIRRHFPLEGTGIRVLTRARGERDD